MSISVFIIAKDEADRISKPINSVKGWVDEVIVIDSGSTDGTVAVAESLGARVVHNEWKGYGPQKVFGETLCRNNWLLNLDADEEITPQLRDEILALFAKGEPEKEAYAMRIKVMSRFDHQPRHFAPAHNQIRLYRRDRAGFKDSTVHDSVVPKEGVECRIGQLQQIVLHRSFRSYRHAVEKINRYSGMQAEDMVNRGRVPSPLRIVVEPFISFLKGYFHKRYCFLGLDGFVEAWLYAFARTLRLVKARELAKERALKN